MWGVTLGGLGRGVRGGVGGDLGGEGLEGFSAGSDEGVGEDGFLECGEGDEYDFCALGLFQDVRFC